MSDLMRVILLIIAVLGWTYVVISRLQRVIERTVENSLDKYFRSRKV
jgi:hypothetical protein